MLEALEIDQNPVQLTPITSEQMEALLLLQQDILGKVAIGKNHQDILASLCVAAETMLEKSVASIMLFDDKRESLQVCSAPSIPEAAINALTGLVPGEQAGSCGTAVFNNKPQFICDTRVDERWANVAFQDFASTYGILACWSMPIRNGEDLPIGSFALSSMEKRRPHLFHQKLLETCASIASIILKREAEEKELQRLAHFDSLTGLPNRVLFNLRLGHALEKSKRVGGKLAVIFIDVDNFKDINDMMGHKAGDSALIEVAKRISNCLRDEDTLSRMGGDEFTLIIESIEEPLDAGHIADKILNSFKTEPVLLNDYERLITVSIGISLSPADGVTSGVLLQNADIAMFEAKKRGRNGYVYYEQALTNAVSERLELEKDLRIAVQEDQFILNYQPQLSCKDGHLVGAEVLVRWVHPSKGLIPPDQFIAIAEDIGLIGDLDALVTRKACIQCLTWWKEGLPSFKLSANLSVNELIEGYSKGLSAMIDELGFPYEQLELEVTESLVMSNSSLAIAELKNIQNLGISIAMDDFGTGHSSLSQLKSLPISKLKIDRSFVSDIPEDKNDAAIVKTILAMARTLELRVVAEGVETKEQLDFLTKEGCDDIQGYYLSKPLDEESFARYIASI